ncbi:class I SAM-dependent methyltransferase [Chthonobacter rhizosphaerae]|uniref:class I SAM-dependent methyltransferase n=1 Tax=Chthonobacter rhizosphaerae TaxID=2735553 RepID=UPI0015EF87F6|nr:class I SAM-dependent methyltransferase [Chthonobacter rhizosphaerae]
MGVLADRIRTLIEVGGPISVADFMALALGDPEHGYYASREPFGAAGDFVTAPEISQMFGELIGAWAMAVHAAIGAPDPVRLVELGPGRGTLMADLLRAARVRPAFRAAIDLHLVETSPRLRAVQAETLAASGVTPTWHDRIDTLPPGPAIVIANEFFDALPVRQLVRTPEGWRERVIGLAPDGSLLFGAGAAGIDPDLVPPHAALAPVGTVVEVAGPSAAIMAGLAHRIVRDGGALLAIDYGSDRSGTGDTLQAVSAHRFADALERPGEVDVTVQVDFQALAAAARSEGAAVHGPVGQGDFLLALGLLERAGQLGADKDDTARAALVAAVNRLASPDQMGTLFKAIAVTRPGVAPPGF